MKLSRSKVGRSGLTNGARLWLSKVDGRSLEARRFADIIHEAEAERGGPDAMTLAQRSAVRAYAMLCVEREKIEVAQAQGREVNADDYGRLCDRMDRQVRRMGPVKAAARPTVRERYAEKRGKPT